MSGLERVKQGGCGGDPMTVVPLRRRRCPHLLWGQHRCRLPVHPASSGHLYDLRRNP